MNYERVTIEKDQERNILIGMITDTNFLKKLRPLYKPELLTLSYSKAVASWCCEYYDKYNKAPFKDIKAVFESKKAQIRNHEQLEMIDIFLSGLNDEYMTSDFNTEPELDRAVKYFKGVSIDNLIERIRGYKMIEDYNQAEAQIAKFQRIEKQIGSGTDLLNDIEGAKSSILKDDEEIILEFSGDLGKLIRPIGRKDFTAFVGPAGRGKCLSGDSNIMLQDGRLLTVKDIFEEKITDIFSVDDNEKIIKSKISDHYNNGIKDCYLVSTRTGREIKITDNHPLLSFNDGWVSIKDGLSVGDFIAVPKNINFFGNNDIPIDHVKLLAYLLADGGLTGKQITYTKKEPEIKDDFIKIIERIGDKCRVDNELTITVTKGYVSPEKTKTSAVLHQYGMKYCKSIEKTIPDIIFTLKKDLLKIFLNTLFTGDGSVYRYCVEYSTGSKIMAMQVQHLLLRFGILTKITKSFVKKRYYYKVTIRDCFYIKKFCEEIGFSFSKNERAKIIYSEVLEMKNNSLLDIIPTSYRKNLIKIVRQLKSDGYNIGSISKSVIDSPNTNKNITMETIRGIHNVVDFNVEINKLYNSDILWDKIISIEYVGKEQTYDITVPKYHNFIANDIVAHNTWMLLESALLTFLNQKNVLFISLEMPLDEIRIRLMQRLFGKPEPDNHGDDKEIKIPMFEKNYEITKKLYHLKENKKCIDVCDIINVFGELNSFVKNKRFKIEAFPSGSVNIETGIKPLLDNLEHYDNFIPDAVFIDYCDILGPEPKSNGDHRHKINDSWLATRGLGQERFISMFTVSHTNKNTFDRDVRQSDMSEESRKLNHLTLGIAINQDENEMDDGLARFSIIKDRFRRFSKIIECHVTQCLDIGMPCLDSRIIKKVQVPK